MKLDGPEPLQGFYFIKQKGKSNSNPEQNSTNKEEENKKITEQILHWYPFSDDASHSNVVS
jgi:hypothetical protein